MAPPRLPVPRLRPVVFNLTDFDAAGDGKTMNTGAFERAVETISRLANSGGGQLNVPRGRWLTAPFNITSHITIFLEEGAVLLGIQACKAANYSSFHFLEMADSNEMPTREREDGSLPHHEELVLTRSEVEAVKAEAGEAKAFEAEAVNAEDESYWPLLRPLPSYGYGREHIGPRYGSLIHGQHLKDVVITGHNGIIDGQGQSWWAKHKKKLLNYTRGPLVQFMWSRDIVISNITLRNSPFWTIHPYDCKNVTLSGLTILAPLHEAPNTDGIDPDSCQNMLIENCFISVGDDGIAIKSGWDQYGIAYGRPSSNILIRNVTLRSIISAGLSIGSEMSGGVANVTAENVLIFESRRGVRIKTAPGRGGYIQNIEFRNLTLDNVRTGIVIKTDYNEHADAGFDPQALPVIDGISFEGVRGRGVRVPVRMHGSEEIPVRGVKFRDLLVGISYKKKRIFQCSYVEGRVVGPVFPAPCEDLDLYDEEGRLVKRATHKNDIVEVDYDG
ncbi:putative polygalacturonase [Dendrobium catenatum]|uniref:Putative polygalacturonase n=1 Tax=Dendrobium catenatum TaxID=906689 RepID=A0A2I0WDS8_9ASPA|nr:putative polygalacturonase [Dendrobium catenatum]